MMEEQQARETIVKAGVELLKSGLIVRTWGNISCRLDDTRFAITPSGRAYETLKPEDIVICKIADGKLADGKYADGSYAEASCTANIKPSSEKGVHALVYRKCNEAGFVIHTHQRFASAAASSGVTFIQDDAMGKIPVATYSLPGTKKLTRCVGAVMAGANGAILMSHHGALCYGRDYGEAFSSALALEDACGRFMHNSYMKASGAKGFDKQEMLDYYVRKVTGSDPSTQNVLSIKSSSRDGIIACNTDEARIHLAIYAARPEINNIELAKSENVVAASLAKKPLPRLLDDFAQMMGRPMRIAPASAKGIQGSYPAIVVKALGKTGGVLVPGAGALCCASTESDAHALCLVTEKNALAEICAAMLGRPRPLSSFDCYLMHLVYTKKYSKLR